MDESICYANSVKIKFIQASVIKNCFSKFLFVDMNVQYEKFNTEGASDILLQIIVKTVISNRNRIVNILCNSDK